MYSDKISDYFAGVAVKYLSAVDACPNKSNQHEIGGLVKAGFGDLLGRPPKGDVIRFKSRMVLLRENEDAPVVCEDEVSWYDSRHERRSPEYRLYYKSNDVTRFISEGDFFLIGKLHDHSLLMVFAQPGTTTELQLRAIFGIQQVTCSFTIASLSASSLLLPLRLLLEDIGLVMEREATDDEGWLEKIMSRFGVLGFPATTEFSEFARESIESEVDPVVVPDESLIGWMNHEERLFRILERHIVAKQLLQGFGSRGDDVDAFIRYSLSVHNRRKSRVGRAFENHLEHLFNSNGIRFNRGGGKYSTENKSKPDFLFPGFTEYWDMAYPAASLRLLGAKTTCKDRWRQVLSEGMRIQSKHLVTLEPAISESQTNEMRASGLSLVVPVPIQSTYTENQKRWLLSVAEFVSDVKSVQSS